MALTVQTIFDRARFHLNDVGITIFDNTILLLAVAAANDELSDELVSNGISLPKKVSKDISVLAGALTLTLPSDIIVPERLWEKAAGDTEALYVPMTRTAWPVEEKQTTELIYWDWREQVIHFLGATTDRLVRLDYIRTLTDLDATGDPVEVTGSVNYLACKTAALAAEAQGGNTMKADRLHAAASKHLFKLLQIGVRANQATRVRRRPFRLRGIRRFF